MIDTTPAISSQRLFHPFTPSRLNTGTAAIAVEIAHIIPRSLNTVSTEDPRESVWSVMNVISPRISDQLQPGARVLGNNINNPGNLTTLDASIHKRYASIHKRFGGNAWARAMLLSPRSFIQTCSQDHVDIDTTHQEVRFVDSTGDIYITIPDHSGEDIPFPDPHLLRIHLACVKIAYLSGHAEAIERMLSDDTGGVLAWDGSTDIGLILATRM